MHLCKEIYSVSRLFPDSERFGLTAQIRRAAVSVPSNIAEGYARKATGDYLRFLNVARGSLAEVETQLILADELGMAARESLQPSFDVLHELNRVLFGLLRSIEATRIH